ncbi:hypothetical protein G9A89_019887 [Geosiphon pyriformis]|nr:hypothetical protein G9A89_019887 [Geosiphon pyriformis]
MGYKSTETEHSQKYIKVATIGTIGKDHSLYKKALFQYFRKDLGIPAETAYAESDFCNYINAKINCLLGHATDTRRLGEQIHQSLLGYSTAMTTRAITETLRIIDTDIKYYVAQRFPQVQQPVESNPEEYKNKFNNPVTAQAKSTVNKKPKVLSPTTPSYHQTLQSRIVFNPPLETHWTKSLGEYESLFGNLNPAAEQPPAQNLAESASPLTEETAILQSIGLSNKRKQPALAPGEHSNMQTPIPLNITSNTPLINRIMAYRNIAKLEKFSGKEDNAYSWIADAEKAITANSWNNDRTYQSLAEKPISFTKFKLTFLQYFCDPNMLIRLQNQFSIIKQKNHKAYSKIRKTCHPISLQDAITLTRDFKSTKQEANHTQAINLAINRTYQPPQWRENNSNRTISNSNNLGDPILATATTARNLDTLPVTAEGRLWTKIKETHTNNPDISKTWYSNILYLRINCPYMHNKDGGISITIRCKPTVDCLDQSLVVLPNLDQHQLDTQIKLPISVLWKTRQTKSNISPATITEDTTLAIIFPFDIDNLNTHSLFSRAAINQDKPIMALYTDARHNHEAAYEPTKLPSRLCYYRLNYYTLVGNDWLSKANATLDWNTQELQLTFNRQHAQVPATCGHFKNQCTEKPLIEFEDTSMPPIIETYQVSWADDYQTELPPPPIWKEKGKGRAEEELQLSSLGYVTSDQRNLFYQPLRLICVDCEKKLSTMGACIGDNKEWPTATKYYCRSYKWDHMPCLAYGKILSDEGLWNDVPGRGGTCDEASLNRLDSYPHDDHKIWRMASAKAEDATPEEI